MFPELNMTAVRQDELHTISENAQSTEALGGALGRLLVPGDLICLSGQLGAGKTVFSRGIGAGWGASLPLTSPTYNLAHEHERDTDRARLYHLDFYRVNGARDAETLGIHEILDSGDVIILEWPERVLDILPADHLWIDIMMREENGRDFSFTARGKRHAALLHELRQALGLKR